MKESWHIALSEPYHSWCHQVCVCVCVRRKRNISLYYCTSRIGVGELPPYTTFSLKHFTWPDGWLTKKNTTVSILIVWLRRITEKMTPNSLIQCDTQHLYIYMKGCNEIRVAFSLHAWYSWVLVLNKLCIKLCFNRFKYYANMIALAMTFFPFVTRN